MPKLASSFRPTNQQVNRFTELFQNARKLRGLTQQEVSEAAGVSQSMVSTLEHGPYAGMNFLDVIKLAVYYGIEPNEVAAALDLFEKGREEGNAIVVRMRGLFNELNEDNQRKAIKLIFTVLETLLSDQLDARRKR